MEKFQTFLFKVNHRLPGPKHPSVKFYRLLHQKKNRKLISAQQSRSSNPQRTDAKAKQKRRDKFLYDLAKYWYYNQRKKAVRLVMNDGESNHCKIKVGVIENHLQNIFSIKRIITHWSHIPIRKTIKTSFLQIKKIQLNTAAGPGRVLVKTLHQLSVAKPITSIANTMLRSSYVPRGLRYGKMILIDKDGEAMLTQQLTGQSRFFH